MPPAPPQLVLDDPWLEPYADRIRARVARFADARAAIKASHGGLAAFSALHQEAGIHRTATGSWHVQEWAPGAQGLSLDSFE